jgi:HlyD family secretion protein
VKRKWKILIAVLVVVLIGAGAYARSVIAKRGIVSVQTGRVVRQDVTSLVTASGEIKPRNYINIGANAQGQLTEILVKEGQRVSKGQLLAKIENVQPEADVAAQRAAISSAEADSNASEAALKAADDNLTTMQASIDRAKADLERTQSEYQRAAELLKDQLIARQDFDVRKTALDVQRATLREAEARLIQARAQREQQAAQLSATQKRIAQVNAGLTRFSDVLRKHNAYAPLDGVVTNLPVRVGETVVPGIQNSSASTIMTIADMSLITSEVKVDETDIVNVRMGQDADVTIDAVPGKTFHGKVTEIGSQAVLRSSGLATTQSTTSTQEAKDFKVVVTLDSPPENLRPGLSTTAKIKTAEKKNVVAIPIQALAIRSRKDIEDAKKNSKGGGSGSVTLAAPPPSAPNDPKKDEIQGVFVVNGKKAIFKPVKTGISGVTDIEVTDGLQPGDEIVVGSYKALRTLKPEAQVKVDNSAPKKAEEQS